MRRSGRRCSSSRSPDPNRTGRGPPRRPRPPPARNPTTGTRTAGPRRAADARREPEAERRPRDVPDEGERDEERDEARALRDERHRENGYAPADQSPIEIRTAPEQRRGEREGDRNHASISRSI